MSYDPNYECATCGTHDRSLFARCQHPGCPDGHDQGGTYYPPIASESRASLNPEDRKMGRVLWLVILFIIISTVYSCTAYLAHATDHGFSLIQPKSDRSLWIEGVQRPDMPKTAEQFYPCCGKGDMYEADVYDIEGYDNGRQTCSATITDGSAKQWPDGTHRIAIPNGTTFNFPCDKVNHPEDGNPTGHAQAFLSVSRYPEDHITGTWCFIPLPPGM